MKALLAVLPLLLAAACGADGDPLRPSVNAGVSVTPGGVRTSASVGVDAGNVSVRVGL